MTTRPDTDRDDQADDDARSVRRPPADRQIRKPGHDRQITTPRRDR